jgi:hypothetical protein
MSPDNAAPSARFHESAKRLTMALAAAFASLSAGAAGATPDTTANQVNIEHSAVNIFMGATGATIHALLLIG